MPSLYSINVRREDVTVAISGFAISFFGSLPLGTANVLLVQLAASDGARAALWFAAGCLMTELIYVWLSLAVRSLITLSGIMPKVFQWVSVVVLAGLAIASFASAIYDSPTINVFLPGESSPFIFGFMLMAINPVQAPFWFGWSAVLFERKVLLPLPLNYALYIVGIGLGSIAADLLFILTGHFIFTWFPNSQKTFQLVIGGIYVTTALYLAWSNVRRRN
jgi:threonine/homoserine/homoserine lactone efflux protein